MTLTVLDPVTGTASAAALGAAVPASTKRKILKCLAYNPTAAVVSIKVFIVPSGQTADSLHTYVDYDLQPRETYTCPEVVGYVLQAGGLIEVLGAGVNFSATCSDTAN